MVRDSGSICLGVYRRGRLPVFANVKAQRSITPDRPEYSPIAARSGRLPGVEIRKLEYVDGFVLVDLPDATNSVGPVRLGTKLIVGNATNFAREITYGFALLGQQRGGMTIGLKVDPEGRSAAVEAVAQELSSELESGQIVVDPGMRMDRADLGTLSAHDPRSPLRLTDRGQATLEHELTALGAVVVGDRLVGLDGSTVAIEGLSALGVCIAHEVERRGGSIGRVSTSKGSTTGNLTADDIASAYAEHGLDAPAALGEVGKPWTIWQGDGVDVIFCGSAPGVLTATGAAAIGTTTVIATGVAPVATKALAMLTSAGSIVTPAFLAQLGSLKIAFDSDISTPDDARTATESVVSAVLDEIADDPAGIYVAACIKAEAFMGTWAEELPFGRPMA